MAEKLQQPANASNGSKTPRPEIKRKETTDKDLDDYFVCATSDTPAHT
jgi:hypothetical protein